MKLFKSLKENIYLYAFIFAVLVFFSQFFLKGFVPVPSDAMVGLYHPFRDYYAREYPRGVPFKNDLITDPVRQIIPWKAFSIEKLSNFSMPLWNPYEMAGKPNLANFQSSSFYPLNIILFFNPFYLFWSIFILIQPILAGMFMYFYLRNLKIDQKACFLGAISFSFSGFFVAWLEWGTVIHTALWLPLILLSIDKVFVYSQICQNSKLKTQSSKLQLKTQNYKFWATVFILSLVSSFFAGHLQTFFYLFIFSFVYFFARWFQFGRRRKLFVLFIIYYLLFIIITSIQWLPTLQFILLSARNVDQVFTQTSGWFIPWQNMTQFLVPDFFGNPATGNYWGVWNYAEFVGYIGVLPLIFALFAVFNRKDKKTMFYSASLVISLLFAFPTFLAVLPYKFLIPFLSTAQPTRLLFITCFSLSILAALGLDLYLRNTKKVNKNILFVVSSFALIYLGMFISTQINGVIPYDKIDIVKRNLIFPFAIFIISSVLIICLLFIKNFKYKSAVIILILIITVFDLLRFANKFEPFTNKNYFFPSTKTIEFLQRQKKPFRLATNQSEILAPNFSTFYKIESIEGYDPLYLLSYAELIAASERNKPDINPPFGFNRIITPHNLESKFLDLLNVKYVLSLSDINSLKFKKVFQEGSTIIYENKNVLPRAFFVEEIKWFKNKQGILSEMFKKDFDPKRTAVVEIDPSYGNYFVLKSSLGKAEIIEYTENRVVVKTNNKAGGFLILTDTFYPSWKVFIDGEQERIYKTDYTFRGVFVPRGEHEVKFEISLF